MIPTNAQIKDFSALSPAARREVNRNPRNFLLFFAYYYLDYLKYPFAPFHADFADDLADLHEGIITRLVWCTAAETSKTSFAQAWLIWNIVTKSKSYPNVDSHDRANAERFLFETIHHLQTNDRIKEDYSNLFNSTRSRVEEKQEKRIDSFVTENGVRCESHTCQESLRGRKHFADRPDCFFIDDFETLSVVRSEAAVNEVATHLSELKRGMAQIGAWQLYLCNYLSDSGNVAALKADSALDPKMRFREVKRVGEDGKPTWPGRDVLTDADLTLPENAGRVSIETKIREMRKADSGDSDWMREMQLQPTDPLGDGPDKQGYMPLFKQDSVKITSRAFLRNGPFVIGVDPAGEGSDSTSIVIRSAFQAQVYATEKTSTGKSIALLVVQAMKEFTVPAQQVVIDAFGVGFKAVKELSLLGLNIKAVNVGEKEVSKDMDGYLNDRAYGYFQLRDWLAQGGELCDHQSWKEQLRCIRHQTDGKNRRHIIPKKEIIKRGFRSPDCLDALMLSMLAELRPRRPMRSNRSSDDFDKFAVI